MIEGAGDPVGGGAELRSVTGSLGSRSQAASVSDRLARARIEAVCVMLSS
jgi:hypothetical protein